MRDIESILGLCASTGTCNKHKCESCDVRNPLSQQLRHSLNDASARFSAPSHTHQKHISILCVQSVDPFSKPLDSIMYNLYVGGTAYHKAARSSRAASPRSAGPLKSVQQQQLYSASLILSRTLTVVLTRAPQCVTQGTTHHPPPISASTSRVATSASAYKGAQSTLSQCVRQHELTRGRSNVRLDGL